ncbi:MAG: roadblock/LC7 domain-containing protein [Gemmatimonadaceae bacterium]
MNPYRSAVEALSFMPGVRGAVVAATDGVVVDAVAHQDVRADQVAAFGNAVFRASRAVAAGALDEAPRYVSVDAERGRLCMAGNDDVTVVVLCDARMSTGRVRMALLQIMETLA